MRDLGIRKQLKEFGKGLIKGTGVKQKPTKKSTKEGLIKGTGVKQKPTKKSSTGMRATSRKLKGAKAISKKLQK